MLILMNAKTFELGHSSAQYCYSFRATLTLVLLKLLFNVYFLTFGEIINSYGRHTREGGKLFRSIWETFCNGSRHEFFFFIPYFYKQGINWEWSEITGSLVTSFISFMPLGILTKFLHLSLPMYTVKT